MEELVRRGELDGATSVMFREVVELSEEEFQQLRGSPTWAARVAAAHTVPRELRAEEGYRLDPEQFRSVTAPALLMLGSESPSWARQGTELARAVLPNPRLTVLPGQGHAAIMTAPELFTAEVVRFLETE